MRSGATRPCEINVTRRIPKPVPENPISSPLLPPLASARAAQFAALRAGFDATGGGAAFLRQRSEQVDAVVRELYSANLSRQPDAPPGLCLAAVGGYGRQELFPYSDLDLLFVAGDERPLKAGREGIATLARTLWDLQMRVSHSTHTLEDCGRLHAGNLEFSVSLLDARYLAGDRALFESLRSQTIPHLIARDGQDLVRNLVEMTLARHAKHGRTIFHLEPDVKESPGGLRDYHVARWLALLAETSARQSRATAGELFPDGVREPAGRAFGFLSAVRCFLHFQQGRNDNLLTYELHEKAAATGLGTHYGTSADPALWMREYYRHVRLVDQLARRMIEDSRPSRSSLYGLFQDWRSRLSNADFSVIRGKIYPRSLAPGNWPLLLSLFEMMARHSLELSREAERWVEDSRAALSDSAATKAPSPPPPVWPQWRRVLALPATADALRAMHRLGLLSDLVPEFRAIDALVIRDFFHRYTVDEHTFTAIQTVCELKQALTGETGGGEDAHTAWKKQFAEIYSELAQPEILTLALLLHDTGKGMAAPEHVVGSLEVAGTVCARLGLTVQDTESVRFLIARHLEMSITVTRRDIFDPETLRIFAARTGSTERLKMLCLLTYADINAVNSEALTPWKAEMLWQLYAMTTNYFSRSVDQDRLDAGQEAVIEAIPTLKAGGAAGGLKAFLDGFPRRYLAAHSPSEIGEHYEWARNISQNPVRVQVRHESSGELTVLATDRPFLFASVTGTLAAWGMNILKAEAFANSSGIVLDVFRFHDLHRTLELNPSEMKRLEENVADVLSGKTTAATLMRGRINPHGGLRPKVWTATQVNFDDESSSRCAILELIAQDRPGLLYRVSTVLAELECNIEVALVETEAEKAVDVFYLTRHGAKLGAEIQQAIRRALLEKLAPW